MSPDFRPSFAGRIACLMAVALCLIFVAESSTRHTDDGCPVEIHCQACRLSLSGKADIASAPVPLLHHEMVGWVQPQERPQTVEGIPPEASMRGPPAA